MSEEKTETPPPAKEAGPAKPPVPPSQHPILKAAMAHHKPADLREMVIHDWTDEEGEPVTIYFWPWNLADQNFFEKRVAPEKEGIEAYADVFIRKAINENGAQLFDMTHRKILIEKVDSTILIAACRRIMNYRSKEYFLKNFSATPDAG